MKAIMVMFDSLNRHMLPPYGYKDIVAPNFQRLAKKTITFDHCYAGSLPCMPARRELHTGRYNFLHRSWGPLEPYDDSMPEILKRNGIYTHLTTDHWHYWEEGDCWKGRLKWEVPPHIGGRKDACGRQEYINRYYMKAEENQSIAVNFANGLEFIENNHGETHWFLQLENFDPHEPFFTPQKYKEYYKDNYNGVMFDWPGYHEITETQEQVEHCINEYKALVTMCDYYLGKVLDLMDQYDMWDDTLLIVNTDHGFLLGEHNWWGKVMMPYFNEIAHTPLFIWDPRAKAAGERRQALVQTIDLAPTILDFFGLEIPENMQGKALLKVMKDDSKIRDYALFGQHGVHVNITDGRYVYMRAPVKGKENELFNYVIMPNSYPGGIGVEEMNSVEAFAGFNFTKGMPVWKMKGGYGIKTMGFPPKKLLEFGTLLYDLEEDPMQEHPIKDEEVEKRMKINMVQLMMENDAPEEQYIRIGLELERSLF
ncbi:sulfatase-like hydrolase/transferase [Clostridium sp. MCC353]|uniref:sulfatase n=1 Tax=Clostridium sp. MCC353 TaxID=2592646 RepID=UPI001C020DFA|nr:sulfatase [Clostridium sp. MCC353]MBT9776598.1 sulfatase-like hydrolase/transferase [Clostridium sp. MCC353]